MKTYIDICQFACISPVTKNVGAILIQNEDLNALQTNTGTGTMNHTLNDICLSKWLYKCNTILLDYIVLINTSYKLVYCNCFKVE